VLQKGSPTRKKIRVTTTRLTGLAKIATQTGKQIGLAGMVKLPGLAQAAARIDRQIRLVGLTGLAGLVARSKK
jgi:hypothetical protein